MALNNKSNSKKSKQIKETSIKEKQPEKKYRASFKEKKVYSRKLKLSEINNLSMLVVIVPREKESEVSEYIALRGGIILSKNRAKGVSRATIFSGVGASVVPVSVLFTAARSEDAPQIITSLSEHFRLDIPGNGKAFMIDILGYMGAKAPFIEKRTGGR